MDFFNEINQIPFLNIFQKLGIATKKDGLHEYRIQVPNDTRISNGSYKLNEIKNIVYANGGTRPQGNPFSFLKEHLNCDDKNVFEWFEINFGIKNKEENQKKQTTKKEILQNTNNFLFGSSYTNQEILAIKTWLSNRGFNDNFLNSFEGEEKIKEVFKTIGFCENPSTKKIKDNWLPSRPVLIFPAYNDNGQITGVKMRKINNKPENEEEKASKSINVTGSKSGIIYHDLDFIKNCKNIIIVEGEPDYIVMRMLGYDNVIGNLGGVNSCRDLIKSITKNIDTVIIAYDNDNAGKQGALNLMKYCNRQMFYISYIERKNIKGELYKDINDYLAGGFNKSDFDKMIKNSIELKDIQDIRGDYNSKDSKVQLAMSNKIPFIYLRKHFEYFDIYENKSVKKEAVCDWTGLSSADLKKQLVSGEIKKYYDVCYWKGGKKDHYNILDEQIIMKPSDNPFIHPDIDFLIKNLCGNDEKNYNWLHKAILYKYLNINDVLIPAVLFKGVGGSGKGTFIKLLKKIFADENVMQGLGTNSLMSDFCPYTGNKIIVEINELGSNEREGSKILDKLKSLIFEPVIMVNKKGVQPRESNNIAWFIISSNNPKPLKLDPESSGNRRFTVIKTGGAITREQGLKINETIANQKNVSDYIAWLLQEFPEVKNLKGFNALDNDDKRALTEMSENGSDGFFKWFEKKYPNINKISNKEMSYLLIQYRAEIGEDGYDFDKKYSIRYFKNSLPHFVTNKKLSIRGISKNGYLIHKELKKEEKGYFPHSKFEDIFTKEINILT